MHTKQVKATKAGPHPEVGEANEVGSEPKEEERSTAPSPSALSTEEARAVLRQHKVKVTWLNPRTPQKKSKKRAKDEKSAVKAETSVIYPQPLLDFARLRHRFGLSERLATNIDKQGYSTPTEVQVGALPILLDEGVQYLPTTNVIGADSQGDVDLLTVAPTGSGKTLAFMIPLLHGIVRNREGDTRISRKTSAVILAPTKELVGQIVNEGRKLATGTNVRITQLRKGMKLSAAGEGSRPAGDEQGVTAVHGEQPAVKADILVSTPGLMQSILGDVASPQQSPLSEVQHLVLDEADVLLDPLFRDQTLALWGNLPHTKLRVSLWSATMGSNIEQLARSTINQRKKRVSLGSGLAVNEAPLLRLVVGLKDSAVPNVEHKLVYAATEQGKLMGLRQLLHPASPSKDSGPPLLPPFLVFTQTIERAIALHSELLYDIPAEAGGIGRVAVLHSDLSDTARDSIMTRFRKGEIWVLITTDLLSRGVDFRGVNGVVNYDIPTSSAAYVHRVGRTGRAGRQGGVAVTLYSKEDIPYLKHVANVVAMAQTQKQTSTDGAGLQQWLLDALPRLSKPEKLKLKKRGIESRTVRGKEKDPKAARRARISSKAGFVRQAENNRRGAVPGSQRRAQVEMSDEGDETDFGGFD